MWREGLSLARSSSSVCVCWFCSSPPFPSVRFVALHPTLYTADSLLVRVYTTPYLEAMVPQVSMCCIDLSARLHGLVARPRKTWIS